MLASLTIRILVIKHKVNIGGMCLHWFFFGGGEGGGGGGGGVRNLMSTSCKVRLRLPVMKTVLPPGAKTEPMTHSTKIYQA